MYFHVVLFTKYVYYTIATNLKVLCENDDHSIETDELYETALRANVRSRNLSTVGTIVYNSLNERL